MRNFINVVKDYIDAKIEYEFASREVDSEGYKESAKKEEKKLNFKKNKY